jgi:hypothetical protein
MQRGNECEKCGFIGFLTILALLGGNELGFFYPQISPMDAD